MYAVLTEFYPPQVYQDFCVISVRFLYDFCVISVWFLCDFCMSSVWFLCLLVWFLCLVVWISLIVRWTLTECTAGVPRHGRLSEIGGAVSGGAEGPPVGAHGGGHTTPSLSYNNPRYNSTRCSCSRVVSFSSLQEETWFSEQSPWFSEQSTWFSEQS